MVTPVAGLVATALLTLHAAGGDQLAGVLTGARQSAAYQLGVEPQSPRRHRSALVRRSPASLRAWRSDSWACSKTATCSATGSVVEASREATTASTRSPVGPAAVSVGGLRVLGSAASRSWRDTLLGPVDVVGRDRLAGSSRWRQAATATTRHQSSGGPRPDASAPSSTGRSSRPADAVALDRARPAPRPARPRSAREYVGRWSSGRRDQLLEPGHAGQHQQAVPAHRDRALDVGVEAVADHQRVLATDAGRGSPRTVDASACRPPGLAPGELGDEPDQRAVARPDPVGGRDRDVGVAGDPGQPFAHQDRRPARPASTACPGRSPAPRRDVVAPAR